MESYRQNQKIVDEKESVPSTLPLNIKEGKKHAEGGESDVWEIQTQDEKGVEKAKIALKMSKRESFATDEEMQESKKFYEFLKNFPGFGKFVPETLYFKARETAEASPKSFCIQEFAKGERIDRLKDDAIYKNPAVVKQLLEFVDASIQILEIAKKDDTNSPDFMRTPELNSARVLFGAMVLDPRYSSNILIADKPDKNGQQVFFVDVGANANARLKKGWEHHGRGVVNSVIEFQFKKWKKKLEGILAKQ